MKLANVSHGTVVNAKRDLAAEARRKPRETSSAPVLAKQTERRARAQQLLKGALANGPKRVSDVEEAAAKAHVDMQTLEQARADFGVTTTRGNVGGGNTLSVQWSLPG